jgi:hypothetical protein
MPSDLPYPLVIIDRDVHEYCRQHGMAYAPWGLLWGSLDALDGPEHVIEKAGQEVGVSKRIAWFACLRTLGGCQISILCGTTKEVRMHETLTGLAKADRYLPESEEHRKIWKGYADRPRVVIDGSEMLR